MLKKLCVKTSSVWKNDIWDLIPEFFCAMVKQSGNLVTNSSLCLEDEVFFLCGKYMDSLKVVCTTGGER